MIIGCLMSETSIGYEGSFTSSNDLRIKIQGDARSGGYTAACRPCVLGWNVHASVSLNHEAFTS